MIKRHIITVTILALWGASLPAQLNPQRQGQAQRAVFQRILEPNHNAFSMVIPQGWTFQGGLRYPAEVAGGVGQMMTPKVNFVITSPDGQAGLQWYEETVFWTWGPNPPPAAPMLNQTGFYNGMPITPQMDAVSAIQQLLIPHQRQGQGLQVVEVRPLPTVGQVYVQTLPGAIGALTGMRIFGDAGMISTTSPTRDERFLAILRYVQLPDGSLMWSNPITCSWWAPRGQMAQWEPILGLIFNSMQLNPEWVRGEVMRQAQAGQQINQVQQLVQQIDAEIANNRAQTNAEIARAGALNLVGMHDRRDPTTNQPVPFPNWAESAYLNPTTGEIIASEDPHFDPNDDPSTSGEWVAMPQATMYRPGW